MTKILFNTKYKTINEITDSNKLHRPIHIMSDGIYVDNSDIDTVTKILDREVVKYKLKSI